MKKYVALGAALTALAAGGVALGQTAAAGGAAAAQADGGLSVLPALVEHSTQPGPLATYTVANRSAAPMTVTVAARPWLQSTAGKVSVDRRKSLPGVSVDKPSFTLAPGATQDVVATLTASPSAGALYGALEVVGLPSDAATRKGVVLGHRLIGTIRVLPSAPKLSLVAGAPKASKGNAVIAVRNAGNTVEPVTGSITLRGAGGSRNRTIQAVRILPGKSVNVPLGSKLARGSYTASLKLNQGTRRVLSVNRKFSVR